MTDPINADYKRWQWRDAFLDLMKAARRMKVASPPPEGSTEYHKGYIAAAGNLVSRGEQIMKKGMGT